jgi:hypothetical protein
MIFIRTAYLWVGVALLGGVIAHSQMKAPNRYISFAEGDKVLHATTPARFKYNDVMAGTFLLTMKKLDGEKEFDLGPSTGFFISEDGYFVAAAHGVGECYENTKQVGEYSVSIDCGTGSTGKYFLEAQRFTGEINPYSKDVVRSKDRGYYKIKIISHASFADTFPHFDPKDPEKSHSFSGQDFVIGKIEPYEQEKFQYFKFATLPRDIHKKVNYDPFVNLDQLLESPLPIWINQPRMFFFAGYPAAQGREYQMGYSYIVAMDPRRTAYLMWDRSQLSERKLAKLDLSLKDKLKLPDGTMVERPLGALFQPGISGGPLMDADGRVYGIAHSSGSKGATFLSSDFILRSYFTQDPKIANKDLTVVINQGNDGSNRHASTWYLAKSKPYSVKPRVLAPPKPVKGAKKPVAAPVKPGTKPGVCPPLKPGAAAKPSSGCTVLKK